MDVLEKLRRPHLMLTDICDHHSVAFCDLSDLLDDVLHPNQLPVSVTKRVFRFPLLDRLKPVLRIKWFDHRDQFCKNFFHVTNDGDVDFYIFAYCRWINVYMNFLCFCSKRLGFSSNAVIKPGTNRYKQITIMDCGIRVPSPMHTEHSHG